MTKRLAQIFSLIPNCVVFADIGCDHGYIAKEMISKGKCQKVIISDISEKCLQKAKDLLYSELQNGKAFAVVSDGFKKLPNCDLALIAGMGGEEICNILNMAKTLPNSLVLQPMKNTSKVRKCLIDLGYALKKDLTFRVGRIFYDIILATKGQDFLTEEEIEFGRTNLTDKPKAFIEFLQNKLKVLENVSNKKDIKQETKEQLILETERLSKYVKN